MSIKTGWKINSKNAEVSLSRIIAEQVGRVFHVIPGFIINFITNDPYPHASDQV